MSRHQHDVRSLGFSTPGTHWNLAMKRFASLLILLLIASSCTDDAGAYTALKPVADNIEVKELDVEALREHDFDLAEVRTIRVQSSRRYQPMETFARVAVRQVTGKDTFQKIEPLALFLHWVSDPMSALYERNIRLPSLPVCERFGLDRVGPEVTHTSWARLNANQVFLDAVTPVRQKVADDAKLAGHEAELWGLWQRYSALSIVLGANPYGDEPNAAPGDGRIPMFPPKADPVPGEEYQYGSASELRILGWDREAVAAATSSWHGLLGAFREGDPNLLEGEATRLKASVAAMKPERSPEFVPDEILEREVHLDQLNPFSKLKYFYFGVFFLGILAIPFRKNRILWGLCLLALVACIGFHAWAIFERTTLSGRAMIGNLYESAIFATLAAALVGLVGEGIFKSRWFAACGAFVAMLGLFWAQGDPEFWNPEISKLNAVLINNDLIHIHVPLMMVSYAVLALTVVLAHVYLFIWIFQEDARLPARGSETERIGQYMFWTIPIGVVILFAGIILGGVWADASWGRFWGWDPKETASLVTWTVFVIIIHGWWAGWLRGVGVALACLFGGLSLIWTYWGANFVQSGLHSYAGSSADIPTWPYYYFGIEALLTGLVIFLWLKRPSRASAASPETGFSDSASAARLTDAETQGT